MNKYIQWEGGHPNAVILARTTKGKDHQVLITIVWQNFELHSYLQIQLELSLTQIFFFLL